MLRLWHKCHVTHYIILIILERNNFFLKKNIIVDKIEWHWGHCKREIYNALRNSNFDGTKQFQDCWPKHETNQQKITWYYHELWSCITINCFFLHYHTFNWDGLTSQLRGWTLGWLSSLTRQRGWRPSQGIDSHSHGRMAKCMSSAKEVLKGHTKCYKG